MPPGTGWKRRRAARRVCVRVPHPNLDAEEGRPRELPLRQHGERGPRTSALEGSRPGLGQRRRPAAPFPRGPGLVRAAHLARVAACNHASGRLRAADAISDRVRKLLAKEVLLPRCGQESGAALPGCQAPISRHRSGAPQARGNRARGGPGSGGRGVKPGVARSGVGSAGPPRGFGAPVYGAVLRCFAAGGCGDRRGVAGFFAGPMTSNEQSSK